MSKYIIEIAKEYEEYFKGVLICGIADGKFAVDVIAREDLEELNSDYINEHYGSLQDEAYQRGLQDGKDYYEQGCEGCKHEANRDPNAGICAMCRNSYKNRYERKDADDEIKVGDEVEWNNEFGDRFVVTRIYQPYGQKEQCDGIGDDGDVCRAVLIENLVKTGRHFNVEEILEEMRT